MIKKTYIDIELLLTSDRNKLFEKVKKLFDGMAIESHIFGSIARGEEDAYSDIDIWFTFKDNEFKEILLNRFNFYSQIGEIINICEPPQNAPINGVHSSILYKTEGGYVMVDFYLCPLSTSHITLEGKKIYGIELPIKEMEFNPNKIYVNESYRIDFLIIFIIVAIKNLLRGKEEALKILFDEYGYLNERYGILTEKLTNKENSFGSLKELIEKIRNIANKKQQICLNEIEDFIDKIN